MLLYSKNQISKTLRVVSNKNCTLLTFNEAHYGVNILGNYNV